MTLRILLVEDNLADSTLILECFEQEKIFVDVELARDGEQAMRYLNDHVTKGRPDLVLLDLNLPRKDGREVLSEIKSDPRLQSIPVVILTTSESEEDILRSYRSQASCYVTKPIDLDQFNKIVKSIDEFWFSAVKYPPKS